MTPPLLELHHLLLLFLPLLTAAVSGCNPSYYFSLSLTFLFLLCLNFIHSFRLPYLAKMVIFPPWAVTVTVLVYLGSAMEIIKLKMEEEEKQEMNVQKSAEKEGE